MPYLVSYMDLEIVDKFLHHSNQDVKISEIFGGVSCEGSGRFLDNNIKSWLVNQAPPTYPRNKKN